MSPEMPSTAAETTARRLRRQSGMRTAPAINSKAVGMSQAFTAQSAPITAPAKAIGRTAPNPSPDGDSPGFGRGERVNSPFSPATELGEGQGVGSEQLRAIHSPNASPMAERKRG